MTPDRTELPVVGKPFRKLYCQGYNGIKKVYFMVDPEAKSNQMKEIPFSQLHLTQAVVN
jgi:hypothetical protein